MREELQKQLYERWPEIFAQKDWSMQQTCMCWGIDCDDGWYNIIDNLCNRIQNHVENENWKIKYKKEKGELPADAPNYPQIQAVQVKEKYGGLRFYINHHDDYLDGAISMAEAISLDTCEKCGSPGKPNEEGWIVTLCTPCREEYEKRWAKKEEEARQRLTVKMKDVTVAP